MSFFLTKGVLQQQANRAGGKQYALEFDGRYDYVIFDGYKGITGLNEGSFSFRFKTGSSSDMTFILWGAASSGRLVNCQLNDGVIWMRTTGGSTGNWGSGYDDNEWHYIVVKWPNNAYMSDIQVYADGNKLDGTFNNDISFNIGDNYDVAFGDSPVYKSADPIIGFMNEVGIWGKELSEAEIQEIMGKTLTGNESGLVLCPDFSIGEGDTLPDKTGNGNHGTIYGAKWIEL